MAASKLATLLQSTPKRTLSDLVAQLPKKGVGVCVARDTWHPESGKYWEITNVHPKKDGKEGHFQVWGYRYWHGQRINPLPKQIASVWKHGWMLRPRSEEEKAKIESLFAKHDAAQVAADEASHASTAASTDSAVEGVAGSKGALNSAA